MVVVMETSSGKYLDETCSAYGEDGDDEAMYSRWAQVPRIEARLAEVVASAHGVPLSIDLGGFLARLYARQV